ncbi:uncharacterized protein LOC119736113 [Patiria miniata]|uniref:Uncharacterized protein n=1 Tax=Patiria miniata TaxID=46514 RepID=A0A914ARI3_PATMI|nr:uncharacterized protein LOC119736113 [Patiria miniata]
MALRSPFGLTRDKLAELLSCGVCFEKYDDGSRAAKLLPCLHGFCTECLGRLVRGAPVLTCPLCRRDTPVPEAGVHSLPDHFIVTKLRELDQVLNIDAHQARHAFRCGWCKDESPAVCFCPGEECSAFLCEKCKDHHDNMKAYHGHVVHSMEQVQEDPDILLSRQKLQCEQHIKHALSVFCEEEGCHRAMCLVCSTTDHRGHQIIDLDQKSSKVKEELQRLARASQGQKVKVEDISGRISTEINKTSARFEEMSSAVCKVFEELQNQLKTRQEAVIADLKKLCTDKANQLKHQTDRAESLASQFDSACQFAERACDIGNPVDLLKTRAQIISRLYDLNSLDVDKSLPFLPAGEAFLSFTDDHDRVLSEIESLIPRLGHFVTSGDERDLIPKVNIEFPWRHGSSVEVKAVQKVRISEDSPSCPSVESLGERLFAYLQSPDGSTTNCKDRRQCGDFFEFEFQPLVTGQHQLSISVSGLQVTGSPFQIHVVDRPVQADVRPAPSKSLDTQVLPSDATWADAFARCEHSVVFKLRSPQNRQPQLEQITVRCTMPDIPEELRSVANVKPWRSSSNRDSQLTGIEAHIIETEEKGTFRVAYTPPAAGQLLVTILVDGKPVTVQPIVITVNPLHPDSTDMVTSCSMGRCYEDGAALDVPCTVLISTRDYMGNRLSSGGYEVTATVKPSSLSDGDWPCDVQDKSDGSYLVTFTPRTPEPHLFTVKICGYEVKPNMPFVVPVHDSLTFKDPPGGYQSPSAIAVDIESQVMYVADGKKGCIHRLAIDNGCSVSTDLGSPIDLTLRHTLLIALSAASNLVLLVPRYVCVIIYNTKGDKELSWPCAQENTKPVNITISAKDHVIIGDGMLQTLFVYGMAGEQLGRIQLPEGALGSGLHNVCTDRNNDILVATHSEPYQILRYHLATGNLVSQIDSPVALKQLAVATTPEGVLIVAALGGVLVLQHSSAPEGVSIVRRFQTDDIYSELAYVGNRCFVALDRGKKHLAKYKYEP